MILVLKWSKKGWKVVLSLKFLFDYCMVLLVLGKVGHDDLKNV